MENSKELKRIPGERNNMFSLTLSTLPNTQKYNKCLVNKKNNQISPNKPCIPDIFRFLGSCF